MIPSPPLNFKPDTGGFHPLCVQGTLSSFLDCDDMLLKTALPLVCLSTDCREEIIKVTEANIPDYPKSYSLSELWLIWKHKTTLSIAMFHVAENFKFKPVPCHYEDSCVKAKE